MAAACAPAITRQRRSPKERGGSADEEAKARTTRAYTIGYPPPEYRSTKGLHPLWSAWGENFFGTPEFQIKPHNQKSSRPGLWCSEPEGPSSLIFAAFLETEIDVIVQIECLACRREFEIHASRPRSPAPMLHRGVPDNANRCTECELSRRRAVRRPPPIVQATRADDPEGVRSLQQAFFSPSTRSAKPVGRPVGAS